LSVIDFGKKKISTRKGGLESKVGEGFEKNLRKEKKGGGLEPKKGILSWTLEGKEELL